MRICPVFLYEFVMSQEKMGLIILSALTACHLPTLMLCHGTSCISVIICQWVSLILSIYMAV